MIACLSTCSRHSPSAEYDRLLAEYRKGDLARAASGAAAEAARWSKDRQSTWYWDFSLLEAESLNVLSRYRDAEAILNQEPPPIASLSQRRVRLWIDRAQLKLMRHEDVTDLVQQARQAVTDPELAIRVELTAGTAALDKRQHQKAQEFYRTALELATKQASLYYEANALNNLSIASKRLNRYEESIDYGTRALAAAEQSGAVRITAAAHNNLGPSYAYLGQFEAALDHEKKAVQMNEAMGSRAGAMNAMGELGLIYDTADQVPEAIPQYEHAFSLGTELGSKRDSARFAENLALALLKTKQWDKAAEWNDRAAELAKQSGATANLPYLISNRAQIAWGRGQADEAERLCRELLRTNAEQKSITWDAYELLGEIEAARKRFPQANRDFESAIAIVEGTRSDVLDPRYRVTLLSRMIYMYREYVDALVVQHEDLRALRIAESSRARVLAERLGRDFQPERLADQTTLRAFARTSKAALLSVWIAPKRSFAWLITGSGVRRFDLPPAAEVEALVTGYRNVVEHSVADPLTDASASALWDKLMAAVAREVPRGSRVIVVPDGPVHRLNLETLVAPSPQPHYWIEDAEVAVSPSIAIAMAKPRQSRGKGLAATHWRAGLQGDGLRNASGRRCRGEGFVRALRTTGSGRVHRRASSPGRRIAPPVPTSFR